MAWHHEAIEETPGVCGGYPRIRGTRVPVRAVVNLLRQGATFEEMLRTWPHVTGEQLQSALAYYLNSPARVDEDIARNAHALAETGERQWLSLTPSSPAAVAPPGAPDDLSPLPHPDA